MKETRNPPSLTFELITHGQIIEVERYQWDATQFCLVEATMETYSPPMPLLKFPMRVGDSWEWNGVLSNASGDKKARAEITTSVSPLTGGREAVLATVKRFIDGGAAKPSVKGMAFYFSPGKGMIKREFGDASTREPLESGP